MTVAIANVPAAGSAATAPGQPVSRRAHALADTLEDGARALAAFAATLSEAEWRVPLPHDGRPLGVVVHHVASVYPVEIELALTIASGASITGLTPHDIHAMNAGHAAQQTDVTKADALRLLEENSAAAAAVIRGLSDAQLDTTTTNSLYGEAPLTCQFMLEDHAVRHSYHHLAKIRAAVNR